MSFRGHACTVDDDGYCDECGNVDPGWDSDDLPSTADPGIVTDPKEEP